MVRIKLSRLQLILLHDAHLWKEIRGCGPYSDLLREHCADFCQFFQRLIVKGSEKYTVKFTSLQARAFMQLWIDAELPEINGAYTIFEIIAEFDRHSKQPKKHYS